MCYRAFRPRLNEGDGMVWYGVGSLEWNAESVLRAEGKGVMCSCAIEGLRVSMLSLILAKGERETCV